MLRLFWQLEEVRRERDELRAVIAQIQCTTVSAIGYEVTSDHLSSLMDSAEAALKGEPFPKADLGCGLVARAHELRRERDELRDRLLDNLTAQGESLFARGDVSNALTRARIHAARWKALARKLREERDEARTLGNARPGGGWCGVCGPGSECRRTELCSECLEAWTVCEVPAGRCSDCDTETLVRVYEHALASPGGGETE